MENDVAALHDLLDEDPMPAGDPEGFLEQALTHRSFEALEVLLSRGVVDANAMSPMRLAHLLPADNAAPLERLIDHGLQVGDPEGVHLTAFAMLGKRALVDCVFDRAGIQGVDAAATRLAAIGGNSTELARRQLVAWRDQWHASRFEPEPPTEPIDDGPGF